MLDETDDQGRNAANGISLSLGMGIAGVRELAIRKLMDSILKPIRRLISIDPRIIHGL